MLAVKPQGKIDADHENQKADEIYLRADKTVAYGMVVYVMSEIKGAGMKNWK